MSIPNDPKRTTPSLLLQPPTSGFSWDPLGGASFLMPVSQPEGNSEEVDSFIGQSSSSPSPSLSQVNQQPPVREPSPHISAFKPVATTASGATGSGPLSQLQQPLRPLQTKTPEPPPPIYQPQTQQQQQQPPIQVDNSSTFNVSSIPMSSPPTMAQTYSPNAAVAPPPTGPAQNFRRQTPLTYAPTPGMGSSPPQGNPYSQNTYQSGITAPADPVANFPSHDPYNSPFQPPQPSHQTTLEGSSYYGAPSFNAPQDSSSQNQNQSLPAYGIGNSAESTGNLYGSQDSTGTMYNPLNSYKPVPSHWFYRKEVEKKEIWLPFTVIDSMNLEEAYKNGQSDAVIPTDGGRYDVYLGERLRKAIYWEESDSMVKRSSWFYRAEGQNRYVPYDEVVADKIEEFYREGVTYNRWPQKVELEGGVSEAIVMQNSKDISHYLPSKLPDEWGYVPEGQMTLRVVKRGVNEILTVDEGEPPRIDHLVFLVQGVGAVCDLKFRSVVECVDDFRNIGLNLMRSHYKKAFESGRIGRVEFLPISWHGSLHGDDTGIDRRMQTITLPSIPKLRHFTNDTLMDIFFYTSPIYCQTIVDTVGSEINRIYQIFLERNPNFEGKTSVAGHSLGSLILFDILAHQLKPGEFEPSPAPTPTNENKTPEPIEDQPEIIDTEITTLEALLEKLGLQEFKQKFDEELIDFESLKYCEESDIKEMGLPMGPRKKLLNHIKDLKEREMKKALAQIESQPDDKLKDLSLGDTLTTSQSQMSMVNRQDSVASVTYMVGMAGTGQPSVVYPKLSFHPSCFFALGSPIAMFLTVRGLQTIGEDYQLPTCPAFFNIFHPFDPVAFRMETLIDPQLNLKPVLIPHHKGRKRLHLELRDSLTRVGTDLKQKLMESLKYTWNSISDFARAHRSSDEQVEAEMDKVVQEQLAQQRADMEDNESTVSSATDIAPQEDIQIGRLNSGRRLDYVLQETPIESFNQYLFALASHTCYWESEDTALMILREVYSLDGVQPESPVAGASKVTLYNTSVLQSSSIPQPQSYSNYGGLPQTYPSSNPNNISSNNSFGSPQGPPYSTSYYQGSQPPPTSLGQVSSPSEPVGPPPLTGFVRQNPLANVRR